MPVCGEKPNARVVGLAELHSRGKGGYSGGIIEIVLSDVVQRHMICELRKPLSTCAGNDYFGWLSVAGGASIVSTGSCIAYKGLQTLVITGVQN